MFIAPCILWYWRIKNQKLSFAFCIFFLDTQQISGINMPIFRSLWLCCWTITLDEFVLGLLCVLWLGCGSASVVYGLKNKHKFASAGTLDTSVEETQTNTITQQTSNDIIQCVFQQHSRKRLNEIQQCCCWLCTLCHILYWLKVWKENLGFVPANDSEMF